MAGYCFFVWALVFISLFHGARSLIIVKNVQPLDEYTGVIISPKFNFDASMVAYTQVNMKNSLFKACEVDVEVPSRKKEYEGLRMNLGYSDGGILQLVETKPHDLTSGIQGDITKYDYKVVSVDEKGHAVTKSKHVLKLGSIVYGYRDRFALGLQTGNLPMASFGLQTSNLILTNTETGITTSLVKGVDKVGAVFHPNKHEVFYSIITEAGTDIYSKNYNGVQKKVLFSYPGKKIFITGVNKDGTFLFGFKWDEMDREGDAVAISVEDGVLDNIKHDNEVIHGIFFTVSEDGKRLAFVNYKDGESKLSVGNLEFADNEPVVDPDDFGIDSQ